MSLWKRGRRYWTDFMIGGRRYRKPLQTSDEREAKRKEKELIREAGNGHLAQDSNGPKRLFTAVEAYLDAKVIRCAPRTLELEEERLSIVKRHFRDVPVTKITAAGIADFQQARHKAGIANRTINMDVGALSRVLKSCGHWRPLADYVHALPEHQKPIGRALTREEQTRLFEAAKSNRDWEHVYYATIVAANTSMRPVEVKNLRRRDVDISKKIIIVRRSKNESSHRILPLNASALRAMEKMILRADALGFTEPDHYLWPACQWGNLDPTRPIQRWDTAWRALRDRANLPGLRFHDLRHTVITELAELGVADHVLESISGHLSRKMLEHYSHIRLDAKRKALEMLDDSRQEQRQAAEEEVRSAVDDEAVTSQSTSQSSWIASARRCKLLVPFKRRDVRVVEGARLESVCRGNSTVGSNPTLSANLL
jgi:integrase